MADKQGGGSTSGTRPTQVHRTGEKTYKFKLKPKNWGFICAGIICVGFGFFLLSKAILTLSAILLVVGYCILMPIGIMIKD